MPHISSKKLSLVTERALEDRLIDILRIIGRDRKTRHSLKELLTPTESVMLAKRLAIIYLISKEKSTLDICETLLVSSSTVIRMEKNLDRGGYRNLQKTLKHLEPSLLDIIEIILGAGMPPIVGRGRLKHLTG